MKKIVLIVVMLLGFMSKAWADERVRGHWKDTNRDGVKDTYIQPYNRSDRNNSVLDNYSSEGNTNSYTGKKGTIDPYKNNYQNPYDYSPYNKKR